VNALRDASALPCVAHLLRTWVAPSETFIVGQVVGSTRTRPLVVARHERDGARALLQGAPLLRTTEGLGAGARAWAGLAWKLRRMTRREGETTAARLRAAGVALLHAHFGSDAAFFAPLWRRLAVPRVVSFYGYDAVKTARRLFGYGRVLLRPVVATFDAIVVPSQDMARDVEALGAPAARVRVLPWGIDLARFRPEESATAAASRDDGAAGRPLRLISVCRFIAKKGLGDALAAFARLRATGIDAELLLVGDGPLRDALVAMARALGVGDRVRFTGFVEPARLPELLRRHDVFLHPSVTPRDGDKEGVPTTILEAAACALPVVATRHGGIPEAVEDGATGCLVAEGDVAALAERLIALARDPALRRKLGAAGRVLVEQRFDVAVQNARREELYFELLAARRGAAPIAGGA